MPAATPEPSDEGFSVEVGARADEILVRVAGELDVHTERLLTEALIAARAAGRRAVVVDLATVTFMDCRGLSALLRARCGGPVRVTGATGVTALVLDVTGARDVLVPADASAPAGA